jgi:hypothetical protein
MSLFKFKNHLICVLLSYTLLSYYRARKGLITQINKHSD